MSWIKKSESELEDEKKEKIAYLAKQKKQEQEEYIPTHPYNILHSDVLHSVKQLSWLNKDTKDNVKKPDHVETIDNSSKHNVNTGWKEISYTESLNHIAKMIKSSNEKTNSDKLLLANMINR
jgi:hypothetical protein